MNTLILSCNTGAGHNSCAAAIKTVYDREGEPCDVADALAFISPGVSRLVSNWHVRLYRYMPGLYEKGYRYAENHSTVYGEAGAYRILYAGSERLYQVVLQNRYDTVICTHVFGALMVTHMLEKHPSLELRTALVVTDYSRTPGQEDTAMDHYFIADETLREQFLADGIPDDKIEATGIPIQPEFLEHMEKEKAKEQNGIAPDRKHLLVMCGSMGCGPMVKLGRSLLAELPEDMEATILCGTNRRLWKELKKNTAQSDRMHILGYTTGVARLMDSADLYLTKPGGISVTEAGAKCLPMALINAVSGCEEPNFRFFVSLGGAITADTPEALVKDCIELLGAESDLRRMKDCLSRKAFGNGAEAIYRRMAGVGKKEEYANG